MSFSRKTSVKIGVGPEAAFDGDVLGKGFEHRICSLGRNDPHRLSLDRAFSRRGSVARDYPRRRPEIGQLAAGKVDVALA